MRPSQGTHGKSANTGLAGSGPVIVLNLEDGRTAPRYARACARSGRTCLLFYHHTTLQPRPVSRMPPSEHEFVSCSPSTKTDMARTK